MVGIIEGLAEATALIVKIFSGALSDYLGRRKGLALFGYTLGALTKPLFAIAPVASVVLTARLLDRVGKGIRGAPRDALVADIAPAEVRGAAFGLRQSMDTVGAFLGPLLAVGLMLLWNNDFRAVFWVAVIPGLLSVLLLLVGVREPKRHVGENRTNPFRRESLTLLSMRYWWVVGLGAVVALARFSEAFLVLRAQQGGIPIAWVPLVMVAMNLVYATTAYAVWQTLGPHQSSDPARRRVTGTHYRRFGSGSGRSLADRRYRCPDLGHSYGHDPRVVSDDGGRYRACQPEAHRVWLFQPGQRRRHAGGQRPGWVALGPPGTRLYVLCWRHFLCHGLIYPEIQQPAG